jgi:glucose-6-phosphate 1-dehydrogenase
LSIEQCCGPRDLCPLEHDPNHQPRGEKVKVLKAMQSPTPISWCAASMPATWPSRGVAAGSTVETYAALRVEIGSWRWAGRAPCVRFSRTSLLRVAGRLAKRPGHPILLDISQGGLVDAQGAAFTARPVRNGL